MAQYRNAKEVLPAELFSTLQRYAAGMQLYVPFPEETRAAWGSRNGTRRDFEERNRQIRRLYQQGASVTQIAHEYHLSWETVRKLVRGVHRNHIAR